MPRFFTPDPPPLRPAPEPRYHPDWPQSRSEATQRRRAAERAAAQRDPDPEAGRWVSRTKAPAPEVTSRLAPDPGATSPTSPPGAPLAASVLETQLETDALWFRLEAERLRIAAAADWSHFVECIAPASAQQSVSASAKTSKQRKPNPKRAELARDAQRLMRARAAAARAFREAMAEPLPAPVTASARSLPPPRLLPVPAPGRGQYDPGLMSEADAIRISSLHPRTNRR